MSWSNSTQCTARKVSRKMKQRQTTTTLDREYTWRHNIAWTNINSSNGLGNWPRPTEIINSYPSPTNEWCHELMMTRYCMHLNIHECKYLYHQFIRPVGGDGYKWHLSRPVLVHVMLCPCLYSRSGTALVCLWSLVPWILHVVFCMRFGQHMSELWVKCAWQWTLFPLGWQSASKKTVYLAGWQWAAGGYWSHQLALTWVLLLTGNLVSFNMWT